MKKYLTWEQTLFRDREIFDSGYFLEVGKIEKLVEEVLFIHFFIMSIRTSVTDSENLPKRITMRTYCM